MEDILLFLLVPAIVFFLYLVGKVFELFSECWHKWGKWIVWQTEDAYCQGRRCEKCGRQQVIQSWKLRDKKDGHTNG